MKFLITGAKGQLGQTFKEMFDDLSVERILADISQLDDEHHYLDITNIDHVRAFLKENPVDCIINCAAYNDVDKAEADSATSNLVNAVGPLNLATVANEIDAMIVHYSTDYVFDGTKKTPYSIDDKPNPISKYGESKLLGETNVQATAQNYFLIRVSWLFGKGQLNFPQKVISWSKNRDLLKIVDDQISCPTYTKDVAKASYDLIKDWKLGLYHITNKDYCSRYEWAEFILNQVGWEGELLPAKSSDFETAAKRPEFSALDSYSTQEAIGYQLQHWKDATSHFIQQKSMI